MKSQSYAEIDDDEFFENIENKPDEVPEEPAQEVLNELTQNDQTKR
jgi:hypothetical protein